MPYDNIVTLKLKSTITQIEYLDTFFTNNFEWDKAKTIVYNLMEIKNCINDLIKEYQND